MFYILRIIRPFYVLEERVRGYTIIVDGRIVQIICETCRKKFWSRVNESEHEGFENLKG